MRTTFLKYGYIRKSISLKRVKQLHADAYIILTTVKIGSQILLTNYFAIYNTCNNRNVYESYYVDGTYSHCRQNPNKGAHAECTITLYAKSSRQRPGNNREIKPCQAQVEVLVHVNMRMQKGSTFINV